MSTQNKTPAHAGDEYEQLTIDHLSRGRYSGPVRVEKWNRVERLMEHVLVNLHYDPYECESILIDVRSMQPENSKVTRLMTLVREVQYELDREKRRALMSYTYRDPDRDDSCGCTIL